MLIYNKQELLKSEKCMIYGAGLVAHVVIAWMREYGAISKISCVMVSKKQGNPDIVMGIPVYAANEILDEETMIIVATAENAHDDIRKSFGNKRNDIKFVSDKLAYELGISLRMYGYFMMPGKAENERYDVRKLQENEYEEALKEWYLDIISEQLNLERPVTFNEKIQWMKLNGITPLMTRLADKYSVREWVKEKIGEKYLIGLLGVWDSFDEINFDKLPGRFVLKCNHGCGYNYIVTDKNKVDKECLKDKFDEWMKQNFAYRGFEMQYKNIVPKIIAEEYIENEDRELFDYKFWCYDGKVEFVMFLTERNNGLKMNNYDRNWNLLPFTYSYENSKKEISKPKALDEMWKIAEVLSEGFPYVRVDLYQLNDGTIKFGEMTFTPYSGACRWSDKNINYYLGEKFKLGIKEKDKN